MAIAERFYNQREKWRVAPFTCHIVCKNNNNDLKLTILGCRLFQTLMMRSLEMFSHINTTMVDEQFIWIPASCSTTAARRLQRKVIRYIKIIIVRK